MAQKENLGEREELAALLTAISIVSKRLAENLKKLGAGKGAAADDGQDG
jgi:hypothetical protein